MDNQTDAPKVSVLVPICNVEKYLPQCLESLKSQTLKEIEFICLDDGSTDSSPTILDDFARDDPRFVVVHKPNSGYGATMNLGLKLAKGTYIGILESDDWADSDCFEALFNLAEKNGYCDIVKANFIIQKPDVSNFFANYARGMCGRVLSATGKDAIYLIDSAPSIWAAIYRRDFIQSNGIDFVESPGASYQDTGFVFKSWIAAQTVVLDYAGHMHYRIDHAGSSTTSRKKVFCVCDEFASIDEFIKTHPIEDKELGRSLATKRFKTYVWNLNRLDWPDKRRFLMKTAHELKEVGNRWGWNDSRINDEDRKLRARWIKDPDRLYLDMRIDALMEEGNTKAAFPYRAIRKLKRMKGGRKQ